MFAAPGGAMFSALHTVYMYGGLVLFGGFLLYDTQKIVHHAEHDHHYDPVNMLAAFREPTKSPFFFESLFVVIGHNYYAPMFGIIIL